MAVKDSNGTVLSATNYSLSYSGDRKSAKLRGLG